MRKKKTVHCDCLCVSPPSLCHRLTKADKHVSLRLTVSDRNLTTVTQQVYGWVRLLKPHLHAADCGRKPYSTVILKDYINVYNKCIINSALCSHVSSRHRQHSSGGSWFLVHIEVIWVHWGLLQLKLIHFKVWHVHFYSWRALAKM